MDEATIREILRRPAACSTPELSRRLGRSTSTIYAVRKGKFCSHIAPELERSTDPWPVEGTGQRDEALVRLLLEELASVSVREAARLAHCSTYRVVKIRSGRQLAHVLPELQRGAGAQPGRAKRLPSERQLAIVADVLRDRRGDSQSSLARRHGVSRQYIGLVKHGKTLEWVLPELPRGLVGEQCAGCCQSLREGHCDLGFPEAWTSDAIDCPAFVAK